MRWTAERWATGLEPGYNVPQDVCPGRTFCTGSISWIKNVFQICEQKLGSNKNCSGTNPCERNVDYVIKIFLNKTAFTCNMFIIQTMSDEAVVSPCVFLHTGMWPLSKSPFGPVFCRHFDELQFKLSWVLQQESSKTHHQVHLWRAIFVCLSFSPYAPHFWFSKPDYVGPLWVFLYHITLKSLLVYTF